jgi:hypothetical protein
MRLLVGPLNNYLCGFNFFRVQSRLFSADSAHSGEGRFDAVGNDRNLRKAAVPKAPRPLRSAAVVVLLTLQPNTFRLALIR